LSPYYTTTYEIQAVDENGCTAINEVTISVKKPRAVYIPNAFSPNGDGDNEKFTVYAGGEVVQVNYLRIFSRWGELLFENDNFGPNDERLGWDGYFKGDVVQSGVYVYVAEVLFVDGEALLFKGDLTVLK
jgi:gliding motility-associated-like protein